MGRLSFPGSLLIILPCVSGFGSLAVGIGAAWLRLGTSFSWYGIFCPVVLFDEPSSPSSERSLIEDKMFKTLFIKIPAGSIVALFLVATFAYLCEAFTQDAPLVILYTLATYLAIGRLGEISR